MTSPPFARLHIFITDQPQFKTLFRSTYLFFLTHFKFQYARSHTSTQAHFAALKAGPFVTGEQKHTRKLSI